MDKFNLLHEEFNLFKMNIQNLHKIPDENISNNMNNLNIDEEGLKLLEA